MSLFGSRVVSLSRNRHETRIMLNQMLLLRRLNNYRSAWFSSPWNGLPSKQQNATIKYIHTRPLKPSGLRYYDSRRCGVLHARNENNVLVDVGETQQNDRRADDESTTHRQSKRLDPRILRDGGYYLGDYDFFPPERTFQVKSTYLSRATWIIAIATRGVRYLAFLYAERTTLFIRTWSCLRYNCRAISFPTVHYAIRESRLFSSPKNLAKRGYRKRAVARYSVADHRSHPSR